MAGRERGECKRIQTRFVPSDDLKQLCLQSRVAKNRGIKKELSFQRTPEMEIIKSSHTCMHLRPPNQWKLLQKPQHGVGRQVADQPPPNDFQDMFENLFFSAGIRAIHLHYLNLGKRIGAYRN